MIPMATKFASSALARLIKEPHGIYQSPDLSSLPRNILIAGNERADSGSGPVHTHIYPALGSVTRELKLAGPAEVDAAVAAARAAFPAWRAMAGDKRRDLMFALAAKFDAEVQALTLLGAIENGSPS